MRLPGFVFLLGFAVTASQFVVAGSVQTEQPGSWGDKSVALVTAAKVSLPLIDRAALTKKYAQPAALKGKKGFAKGGVFQFAEPYDHPYEPGSSGQWDVQGDMAIWRISFVAGQAMGINLGMRNVFLPPGARLFVYAVDRSELYGPYTPRDNKSHGQLWTPVVKGSQVVLELNVPLAVRDALRLTIVRVSQSFRELNAGIMDAKSGSCNINVACSQGDAWRDQIRSVARYTVGGTFICSGTLMNNIYGDHAPYFLTADHCDVTIASAPSMVFYWNYQTAMCGDPTGNSNALPTPGNTGATFVSGWGGLGEFDNGSDFTMVLMDSMPPVGTDAYWSGWDSQDTVYTGMTGIHHPGGHEKSLSIDNGTLTITDYLSTVEDSAAKFFCIGAWDEGTTEGGSSGSGLWNTSKRLVGTLSGGYAGCGNLTGADWYGRLAVHWIGNNTRNTQLQHWLNPPGTPPTTALDGITSCSYATVSVTAPSQTYPNQVVNFTSSVTDGTPPYTYSWDLNRDGLEDANISTASYTFLTPQLANSLLIVRDNSPTGCPVRAVAKVEVADSVERFVRNRVFPTGYSPSAGGGAWVVSTDEVSEGIYSLRSAPISNNEKTDIKVTDQFVAGSISFSSKVSSESGYDCLKFYIDGVQQQLREGEQDWATSNFTVTAGTHTLFWRYTKDSSSGASADAAWLDDVQYAPGTGALGSTILPSAGDTGCSKNPTPNTPIVIPPIDPTPDPSTPATLIPEDHSSGGRGAFDGLSVLLLLIMGIYRNGGVLRFWSHSR